MNDTLNKRLGHFLALGAACLALGACASGHSSRSAKPHVAPFANPGAVIAAEMAFARAAQEQGQWTAFANSAAPGAEMFVPQKVNAAQWLKGRANPPVAAHWQAHSVWSSCDGSYAVTHGDWERPGSTGNFTTVWQRQADGRYKWLLDMSLATEKAFDPSDMVQAHVAECLKKGDHPAPTDSAAVSGDVTSEPNTGRATDGTLVWRTAEKADDNREITVWMRREGRMEQVLHDQMRGSNLGPR